MVTASHCRVPFATVCKTGETVSNTIRVLRVILGAAELTWADVADIAAGRVESGRTRLG
jgi:hypothetical protein